MKAPVADVSASNVIPAAKMRPAAAASKQHGNVQKKAASKEDKMLVYGTTACDFTFNGKIVYYKQGDKVFVRQDPNKGQKFQFFLDPDISKNGCRVMNAFRRNGKKFLVVRLLDDTKRADYEKAVKSDRTHPMVEFISNQENNNRHVMQDDEFFVYASYVHPDMFTRGAGGAGGAAPAAVPASVAQVAQEIAPTPVVSVAQAAVTNPVVPAASGGSGAGGAGGAGGAAQSAAPRVEVIEISSDSDDGTSSPPHKKTRS
jgi:hypothetical protein